MARIPGRDFPAHGTGECVPAGEHDRAIGEVEGKWLDEVRKREVAMMVLDATIYMLVPGLTPAWAEMFNGQISAAKEAYEHATGEESMIGFKRNQTTEKT